MIEIKKIQTLDTWDLRHRILWPEKPLDYVQLQEDDYGQHFGLFQDNKLLSVVSLFIDNDMAQFRKFATDTPEQGKGYGSELLNYIFDYAIDQGVQSIWCNARLSAFSFYQKFGFEISSDKWLKETVEYIQITKDLKQPKPFSYE